MVMAAAVAAMPAKLEHIAGGGEGAAGAEAKQIRFIEPFGVAFDSRGNYYVCEFKGHRVIRVDRAGKTSVAAGTGQMGFSGDGGRAEAAQLNDPHGIVISRGDQMFIADTHNNRVRKVDLKSGIITTVAGNGDAGYSGDGGPALKAAFHGIFAMELNPTSDKLYVADLSNRRVRVVDLKSGTVKTVAGNGDKGVPADGAVAEESPLVDPRAVAADGEGNVYVLERGGNALRVVNKAGRIRTLIAPGSVQPDLKGPKHLTMDRNGDVIIADAENHLVRRYAVKTGKTQTIAGTGEAGDSIVSDDPVRSRLRRPHGVTVEALTGDLYISDSYNHRILKLSGR